MSRRLPETAALTLALLLAVLPAGGADSASSADTGRAPFSDRRDPPARRALDDGARADFDLGLLVFNTGWVEAGTPNAGRRDGLGPLFISSSCDACHNNGARGRPPGEPGGLSNSFVMQLRGSDAVYGAVLNTAALPDHSREGTVEVQWSERRGTYADGASWRLREPRYALSHLLYGSLPDNAELRPRIAAQVFGVGLLESVPAAALERLRRSQARAQRGTVPAGRFGWQGEAISIEDQTARAFAREIGVTSALRPADDCTITQVACRHAPQGGQPEVSAGFMRALLVYQRELAVPARENLPAARDVAGRDLFEGIGCAACHVASLPANLSGQAVTIEPRTDLLLHDLGIDLADRRVDGRVVKSRWRTAPLWGLAHARRFGEIALLHDGRAGSVEEAILWHGGQAEDARRAFGLLPAAQRALLLAWVESL